MCNLIFKCYHNRGVSIILKVDGNDIRCINNGTISTSSLTLEEGDHKLTVAKNSIIYKWYWWLNVFNPIYVLLLLKNRTGGRLGYDDNYASCTLNFTIISDDYAILEVYLFEKEYNKNGKQGSCFLWDDIKGKNIKIKDIYKNKMQRHLIRRWRIAYGLPTIFYCILAYVILVARMISGELKFDMPILFSILISTLYSIYILISFFKEKSVEENLDGLKK